jgi:Secretion system C-terminal sorting domain
MKKYLVSALLLLAASSGRAQIVTVPLVVQEQNQWCWAGCSKCILDHYGDVLDQCTIAEYARSVITWTTIFGTTNCCTNPNMGCNNPNYEAGHLGSIQDIIHHFHNITSVETPGPLTQVQIASQMAANKLFVEHWSWSTGGGHFVVGHGISGSTIYYMNPWPGEGLGFCTYSWMLSDGSHTWDYTLSVTTLPLDVQQLLSTQNEVVYPNPSAGKVWIKGLPEACTSIKIYNETGMLVFESNFEAVTAGTKVLDLSTLPKGIYIVSANGATDNKVTKLVLE